MTMWEARKAVEDEVKRVARNQHAFHNHHEAYAVIAEEFTEYWAEVCKGGSIPRDPDALRTELVQTAAMCYRTLVDLC